jgi:hypothetical protein
MGRCIIYPTVSFGFCNYAPTRSHLQSFPQKILGHINRVLCKEIPLKSHDHCPLKEKKIDGFLNTIITRIIDISKFKAQKGLFVDFYGA